MTAVPPPSAAPRGDLAFARGAWRRGGLRGRLRAPSPGALSLLPLDPAPRGGRAGRAAEHDDAGVRRAAGRAARLRAAAVAVPDRPQRGDLDPAPAARRRPSSTTCPEPRATWRTGSPSARSCGLLQLDLADLPERQRAALVLRELNGLSHAEIGAVLELSPAAVKQAIFEARSALFSCREGREMACHDVRRMLSDGDGRVLRGRGVRAHLRSCPDCRRFRADLEQRPTALRALAPPLPVGGAAALLAQSWSAAGRRRSCWPASRSRAAARRSRSRCSTRASPRPRRPPTPRCARSPLRPRSRRRPHARRCW